MAEKNLKTKRSGMKKHCNAPGGSKKIQGTKGPRGGGEAPNFGQNQGASDREEGELSDQDQRSEIKERI